MRKSFHSAVYKVLRERLVAARQAAGLTQAQLAKKLGRPQSFVAKYEGGERRLDVVEFVSIAQSIGADPVKLLRELVKAAARTTGRKPR